MTKPFLKWAGSKYRILGKILPQLASGGRLVEPFAGSCAVYLNVAAESALICDLNGDLISLYRHLQFEGESFIEYCGGFFGPQNNAQAAYGELRARFNQSRDPRERGALLLYLNRHSFNGLVRYNARGVFNAPFGRYKKPYFPLAEMRAFQRKTRLTRTEFAAMDFRAVFASLRPGDMVYCDPPYVPLSSTASFTAFAGNVFTARDQEDLAGLAEAARRRGIPVILSNHDTEMTRKLYSAAEVLSFSVQRFISRDGGARAAAPELLAVYR